VIRQPNNYPVEKIPHAMPRSPKRSTIHVALMVKDDDEPSLTAFRRAIITIAALIQSDFHDRETQEP
jgi:hypothetical protein